jgi:hypothetical protein
MKDKLRELIGIIADWELPETGETWPSGNPVSYEANVGSLGVRDYMRSIATKALTILDAEGDGGAVDAGLRALLGEKKLYVMRPEHVQDEHLPLHEISFGMVLDDKVLFTSQNTHPARSGVVSDEDFRDAERYREFCKQASEASFPISLLEDAFEMGSGVLNLHFDGAKGERHER